MGSWDEVQGFNRHDIEALLWWLRSRQIWRAWISRFYPAQYWAEVFFHA